MNEKLIDISVIIGFKDWGIERLLLSIASIRESFGERQGEVIVSDFGSEAFESGELRDRIESAGAVYVRTETDGSWSRSRAVNAGYSVAKGSVVVATDADMLFSPRSMEIIAGEVLSDPSSAIVLQCRDLPEGYDHNRIASENLTFEVLHRVSQIRPRWGMGGMFAAHRKLIAAVGGYDNRMHTYGGEDLDLAIRVRRSGHRVRWIENNQVRMYHIWHEPTMKTVEASAAAQQAVKANRAIYHKDLSWKRNTSGSDFEEYRIPWAQETVSVLRPGDSIPENCSSAFMLICPVNFELRCDFQQLVSKSLDSKHRAIVGQVVSFRLPKNRVNPKLDVLSRLPVLAIDSRFTPIVARYFEDGKWDLLGAARRLESAGVKIGLSPEVFGVVDNNLEVSKVVKQRGWEWDAATDLFPKPPGSRIISGLIKNLSVDVLAGIMPAVDMRISSTSVQDSVLLRPITEIATEWSLHINLLTEESYFEAILLNVLEEDTAAIRELESSMDIQTSYINYSEVLEGVDQISRFRALPEIVEKVRSGRGEAAGAIQVAWTEEIFPLDQELLTEINQFGGDFIEIQSDDFNARVWIAPGSLLDVEGNLRASLAQPEFPTEWNLGIFGPIPIEALVQLGGSL